MQIDVVAAGQGFFLQQSPGIAQGIGANESVYFAGQKMRLVVVGNALFYFGADFSQPDIIAQIAKAALAVVGIVGLDQQEGVERFTNEIYVLIGGGDVVKNLLTLDGVVFVLSGVFLKLAGRLNDPPLTYDPILRLKVFEQFESFSPIFLLRISISLNDSSL